MESEESRKFRRDLRNIINRTLVMSSDEAKESFLDDLTYCTAEFFHRGTEEIKAQHVTITKELKDRLAREHNAHTESLRNENKVLSDKIDRLKSAIQNDVVTKELETKLAVQTEKVRVLKSLLGITLKEL